MNEVQKTWDDTIRSIIAARASTRMLLLLNDAPECFEPTTDLLDKILEQETDAVMTEFEEVCKRLIKPDEEYIATANETLKAEGLEESPGEHNGEGQREDN